jgi:MbtH protein
MNGNNDDDQQYLVIANNVNQYSLWPKTKAVPNGWNSTGKEGNRDQCVKLIDEEWLDMRPITLRNLVT